MTTRLTSLLRMLMPRVYTSTKDVLWRFSIGRGGCRVIIITRVTTVIHRHVHHNESINSQVTEGLTLKWNKIEADRNDGVCRRRTRNGMDGCKKDAHVCRSNINDFRIIVGVICDVLLGWGATEVNTMAASWRQCGGRTIVKIVRLNFSPSKLPDKWYIVRQFGVPTIESGNFVDS